MTPTLVDYEGPLGAVEPELKRRRIAVATDATGRICLVRPDSVILEFDGDDEDGYRAVTTSIKGGQLERLGGMPTQRPANGIIGARREPSTRVEPSHRWSTSDVREMVERLRSDRYTVRPNQVYLADGVARHFGIVGVRGASGTPGFVNPTSVVSTVRPAVAPRTLRRRLDLRGRERPNVLILDTGLRTLDAHAEHPALDNCVIHEPWRTEGRWDDEDNEDDDGLGRLDAQAGHGTFISGIIRQVCPDAIVHHRGVLTSYGDGDDASISDGIEAALARLHDRIDIVVMAFGTYSAEDLEPSAIKAIKSLPSRTLVVASAGNDGTSRPYYPAALPAVVGVGALDQGGRAAFSNFGSWVAACAPGVDIVSTYFMKFDDRDQHHDLVDEYRGWAAWSGTSFSAPKVAAAVAQEMYLHGGTAHDAWSRLSSPSALRLPDLGVVVNV